jgi:hypothetical protein
MERPQDLRRYHGDADWTTWLLSTTESLASVKSDDYLKNVYKTLKPEDELIIRVKNKDENARIHLLIREIDETCAKVYTTVIHEIDINTGEDIVLVGEKEAQEVTE